jgi:hypothetical protein
LSVRVAGEERTTEVVWRAAAWAAAWATAIEQGEGK